LTLRACDGSIGKVAIVNACAVVGIGVGVNICFDFGALVLMLLVALGIGVDAYVGLVLNLIY
jgi:hypothetical protein